jgi:hypothetical protein
MLRENEVDVWTAVVFSRGRIDPDLKALKVAL